MLEAVAEGMRFLNNVKRGVGFHRSTAFYKAVNDNDKNGWHAFSPPTYR